MDKLTEQQKKELRFILATLKYDTEYIEDLLQHCNKQGAQDRHEYVISKYK